jgi:Spy/CpxP family protein refolding chaperone
MIKIRIILAAAFLVTFAAGGAAALLISHLHHPPYGPSWLAEELKLTREQQDQMRTLWSEVLGAAGRQTPEQRDAQRLERDQKIKALLSETQRTGYEAILAEYARKDAERAEQRKQAFEEAIRRTKEILTAEQAARYDELMAKAWERGFGPPHGGWRGGPSDAPPPPEGSPPPHGGER